MAAPFGCLLRLSEEAPMATPERPNEKAMVAEDERTLEQARKEARRKKKKSAGEQQIAERLEQMTGAADLDDPQRYHGS
jgi:hypothetical protein